MTVRAASELVGFARPRCPLYHGSLAEAKYVDEMLKA